LSDRLGPPPGLSIRPAAAASCRPGPRGRGPSAAALLRTMHRSASTVAALGAAATCCLEGCSSRLVALAPAGRTQRSRLRPGLVRCRAVDLPERSRPFSTPVRGAKARSRARPAPSPRESQCARPHAIAPATRIRGRNQPWFMGGHAVLPGASPAAVRSWGGCARMGERGRLGRDDPLASQRQCRPAAAGTRRRCDPRSAPPPGPPAGHDRCWCNRTALTAVRLAQAPPARLDARQRRGLARPRRRIPAPVGHAPANLARLSREGSSNGLAKVVARPRRAPRQTRAGARARLWAVVARMHPRRRRHAQVVAAPRGARWAATSPAPLPAAMPPRQPSSPARRARHVVPARRVPSCEAWQA
jgi:hypothetical protein